MSPRDERLVGWLVIAAVAGVLFWALLLCLAPPLTPILPIASPIIR